MADLFWSLNLFLLGLVAGSFLNCVIYRLEKNKSFLAGRSFCPRCKHVLAWYDLVPLLSFFTLGGKCRYCRKKINLQYPLVEMATALAFFLIFNCRLPVFNYFAAPFLIAIFVYDLKHYLIPDKIVYPAIALAFLYRLWQLDFSAFLAAVGATAFFLLLVLVSRGKWMGVGDVKLAFLMGLLLSWPGILVALSFAFFSGAIIGIGLILAQRKSFKSEVPFGPFLVAGTFVALFFGPKLVNWYWIYVQSIYPH